MNARRRDFTVIFPIFKKCTMTLWILTVISCSPGHITAHCLFVVKKIYGCMQRG